MKVKKLGVASYRNIKEIIFEPSEHLNFITGHNGAGKTSIIEALYYISYGKSFKTERLVSLIQQNQDYFHLRCIIAYNEQDTYDVYIKQFRSKREVYINDKLVKNQIEIAKLLPIQLISPDTVQLLTLGPDERRKFLNWGMFYTFEQFNPLWKNFQKAHQARNKILQHIKIFTSQHKSIPFAILNDLHNYMDLVVNYSTQLDVLFQEYLAKLLPVLQRILQHLLPELEIEVKFYRGWSLTQDLQALLESNIEHILETGRVNVGLHRYDLVLKCYGELVQNVLSGGQLKLLSCALKLAQGELFKELNHNQCIYLVDDLAAELDANKQVLFAQQLLKDQNQIFMSYINNKDLNIFSEICQEWTEFAIKKGQITQQYINGQIVNSSEFSLDALIENTVNEYEQEYDSNEQALITNQTFNTDGYNTYKSIVVNDNNTVSENTHSLVNTTTINNNVIIVNNATSITNVINSSCLTNVSVTPTELKVTSDQIEEPFNQIPNKLTNLYPTTTEVISELFDQATLLELTKDAKELNHTNLPVIANNQTSTPEFNVNHMYQVYFEKNKEHVKDYYNSKPNFCSISQAIFLKFETEDNVNCSLAKVTPNSSNLVATPLTVNLSDSLFSLPSNLELEEDLDSLPYVTVELDKEK